MTGKGTHHPEMNDRLGVGVEPPGQSRGKAEDGDDEALSFGKYSKLETTGRRDVPGE